LRVKELKQKKDYLQNNNKPERNKNMGGAASAGAGAASSAAASSATSAATQQATQQAAQQLAQRQALASGVTDAFSKFGDAYANQKTGYSPEMNKPVFANYKYNFGSGVTSDADLRNGGMYSGTNFSNPARRGF